MRKLFVLRDLKTISFGSQNSDNSQLEHGFLVNLTVPIPKFSSATPEVSKPFSVSNLHMKMKLSDLSTRHCCEAERRISLVPG